MLYPLPLSNPTPRLRSPQRPLGSADSSWLSSAPSAGGLVSRRPRRPQDLPVAGRRNNYLPLIFGLSRVEGLCHGEIRGEWFLFKNAAIMLQFVSLDNCYISGNVRNECSFRAKHVNRYLIEVSPSSLFN